MNTAKTLSSLLEAYDEADGMKRITSGDSLAHWESQFESAKEEIEEIIADLGAIECARHIIFSPAL
jgi:hypothetical protein